MIKRLEIRNYKIFRNFAIEFDQRLNILVGNNEAGKSTILEAINLALTKRLHGRQLEQELSSHLFNQDCSNAFLDEVRAGRHAEPPRITIEVYLDDTTGKLAKLQGSVNSAKEDGVGVRLEVGLNEDYRDEYQALIQGHGKELTAIPTEYFKVDWESFAGSAVSSRALPVEASYIDATSIRLQSGADYYLQEIIRSGMDTKQRVELSLAYRQLKEKFSQANAIGALNDGLKTKKGVLSDKALAIAIDTSQRSNWEGSLVPHLNDVPFQFIGQGDQSALKIMLALDRKADDSDVLLIEEPENHLSFTGMNVLLRRMKEKCADKQMIITTHSAYVVNKLGLGSLVLLGKEKPARLVDLPEDTQEYFEKLSGYDTLRLVLAKKTILVEGPSDELVVEKAYRLKHGHAPLEDGVDIMSVRGLSFRRYLEIARAVGATVCAVMDNDGDPGRLEKRLGEFASSDIRLVYSKDATLKTLEPHLVRANGLAGMNAILSRTCGTEAELLDWMEDNKTDCALAYLKAENVKVPDYIQDAIA